MMKELCFLIMSCDKYHDVWKPCIKFFRQFFTSKEYKVYLSTESSIEDTPSEFDEVILTGEGEWSKRLRDSLRIIKEEYVFLLLDDFWLTDSLSREDLQRDISFLESNRNVGVIYLNYVKWRFLREYNKDYYSWGKGDIYRINTRPAIWRKDYLSNILDEKENIWQFERIGSLRSNSYDGEVLCSQKQYVSFLWAVTAGKYERNALRYAKNNGIMLDTSYRKVSSIMDEAFFVFRSKIFMINPTLITHIICRMRRPYDRKS